MPTTNLEKIYSYLSLWIFQLISNNFSSMTFFCAMRILRVIGRRLYDTDSTDFLLIFWHNKKNNNNKNLLNIK